MGGAEGDWSVEEDRLVGRGGKGGWLSTKDTYGDFELDLEYKIGAGGNSGVFLRSPREGHPWEAGLEIQLLDDDAAKHLNIKPWQHTGSVYGAIPPSRPAQKKAGEWNRIRIRCRQSRIVVHLNGERIVDADLAAEEKLKGRPRRGYIGLQDHGTRVEFRNVRLRPEDPPAVRALVPAYFYPAKEGAKAWDLLIASAPGASLAVIANPASGPGREVDPRYTRILERARGAGILLLGYVTVGYGKRPLEEVKADVDGWLRLYPGTIRGIFFDEQASGADRVDFQAALYDYARREKKLDLVVTNPGVVCDEGYLARPAADIACLYEHHEGFDTFRLPAWAAKYSPARFAALPYKVATADGMRARLRETQARGFGCVFVTDAEGAVPWERLPSYWDEQLDELRKGRAFDREGK